GRTHAPRLAQLLGLLGALRAGKGVARTVAGTQILWRPGDDGHCIVTREPAAASRSVLALAPGAAALWDGRFEVTVARAAAACRVGALGREGWCLIRRHERPAVAYDIALSQPAIWQRERLVAAPTLGYSRPGLDHAYRLAFAPRRPMPSNGLVYGLV
ncbi:MAG: hypothetical protein D6782_05960, partial [Alphaproteobacteria bacterium]